MNEAQKLKAKGLKLREERDAAGMADIEAMYRRVLQEMEDCAEAGFYNVSTEAMEPRWVEVFIGLLERDGFNYSKALATGIVGSRIAELTIHWMES